MLRCAAVCCSVWQYVAVCCSVLQCVAVCCSVLQCVAVCCSVLQRDAVQYSVLHCVVTRGYNITLVFDGNSITGKSYTAMCVYVC